MAGGNYSFGYEYTFRAGGGFRERELLLSYEPVRYTLLPGARESRGSPRFAQAFLGAPMQRSRTSRPILRRRSPLLTIAHNGAEGLATALKGGASARLQYVLEKVHVVDLAFSSHLEWLGTAVYRICPPKIRTKFFHSRRDYAEFMD